MRSTRCLAAFSLVFVASTSVTFAQHAIHNTGQHAQSAPHIQNFPGAGAGNFGYNGITFPTHNITFPNQNFNFPNNAFTFPNGGLTFPNYVSNFNLSQGSFVPGVGYYGNYIGNGSQIAAQQARINSTMLMGGNTGVGGLNYAIQRHIPRGNVGASGYHHTVRNHQARNAMPINPLERHLNSMVQDLDSLSSQTNVGAYHRNQIRSDILALVDGRDRPPVATVQQLANHLTDGLAARQNRSINTASIAGDLRVLVNGGNFTKTEINTAINQTESTLRQGGVRPLDVKAIVGDMNSVAGHFASFSGSPVAKANESKPATAAMPADNAVTIPASTEDDILSKLKDKSLVPPSGK